jgi:threonine dehydrogenase-like Zn-dependent dehydrogenase
VPDACDDAAAALAQPMAVAVHALRRGGPAERLVVHGAGGIGAFAIAAATHRRAPRIVAVDVDPGRLARAQRLGAHAAVDARADDVDAALRDAVGAEGADVLIEASGAPEAPARCIAAARPGGRVVIVGLQREPVALDLLDAALREVDIVPSVAHVCATDLPEALAVLAAGGVAEEVVERVLPLERVVDEGIAAVASGAVAGKVLVDPRALSASASADYAH